MKLDKERVYIILASIAIFTIVFLFICLTLSKSVEERNNRKKEQPKIVMPMI